MSQLDQQTATDHEENIVEIANPDQKESGIKLSEKMIVVGVEKGSISEGKILIGDHITHVSDVRVFTPREFENEFSDSGEDVKIRIDRGLKSQVTDKIPSERERLIQKRTGYLYQLARIDYVRGCRFGLGIKHYQNKVIVSRVDQGSLAASCLQIYDRIVDINGIPVSDKDVTRDLLVKSLQSRRWVTMIIERPVTNEAFEWVKGALLASQLQLPSVAMASDVCEIAARQTKKMQKSKKRPKKRGIILKSTDGRQRVDKEMLLKAKIKVDKTQEVLIASDTEGKKLRKVKY